MKIVTAIDSFKGSMTSIEAGLAVTEGIHRVGSRSDCKRPAGYLWICDSSGHLQVAARNCHAYNR